MLYQIYPRSFADTNDDGVGDLRGITAHLDYVAGLGVDAVWLSPIHPSPNADWGYDVADYQGVHPELGSLEDLDALLAEADRLGLRVLLDLVPNHTSTAHPWFVDSRSGRDAEHRDWYVWADPKPDGAAPNNWESSFLGPAWLYDDATGQSYLHHFLDEQADLNWWSDDVREAFDRTLRFWFDRGVAGFRIDVCHMIVKDRLLRDNPPATGEEHWMDRLGGQRSEYNACRPEVHDVLRRWRRLGDAYDPPRVFVGETNIFDLATVASFYGADDELQLAFNFPFLFAPFEAGALAGGRRGDRGHAAVPRHAVLDDEQPRRVPVRDALVRERPAARPRRARGAPVAARHRRPLLRRRAGDARHRGAARGAARPREPQVPPAAQPRRGAHADAVAGRARRRVHGRVRDAVAADRGPRGGDGGGGGAGRGVRRCTSPRGLLALRRELADYRDGAYATIAAPAGVWAWRRGERVLVAVHLADGDVTLPDAAGTIRIGTDRGPRRHPGRRDAAPRPLGGRRHRAELTAGSAPSTSRRRRLRAGPRP